MTVQSAHGEAGMVTGPLSGIKLFDLSYIGVGPWAGMILGAMGATVIKVEQEGVPWREGDVADFMNWTPRQGGGPFYKGLSVVYMHCQLGKRSVFLDLKKSADRDIAYGLLKDADLFIENMKLGTASRIGLGYEDVSRINPGIVYGAYPGWGEAGPYKNWGSSAMVAQAFTGVASITGKRDGVPEILRWYALHDFNAGSYIAIASLLGLLNKQRSGNGMKISVPQQCASIAVQTSRIAEFIATGKNLKRMGSASTTSVPHRAFLCQDNRWLAIGVVTERQWHGLCTALGRSDLLENQRFNVNNRRVEHRVELETQLQRTMLSKPARWWTIQLRKNKVPNSLFYDYETIPDLPQIKANRLITSIRYPRLGRLPFGNIPFQYSKTKVALRPGPWPGQDTEAVKAGGWGPGPDSAANGYFGPSGQANEGPLDGVTVVDMTQGLCGPYASLLLSDAGARVIKVEPPGGDYARGLGPPMTGEVSAVFYHLNRNKEGVRVDITKKSDRDRLLSLLDKADVVLVDEEEHLKLRRLDVRYRDLLKTRPALVSCTLTPFGKRGPLKGQPSSELVLQAMSDFVNHLGVPREEPVRMGPDMANLGAALFGVIGILGALFHKWRTGEGQELTVNILGALIFQRGLNWVGSVDPGRWEGFVDRYWAPPDTGYMTQDKSIAIAAVRSQENLRGFMVELGMEDYMTHELFNLPPGSIMGYFGNDARYSEAKLIWEKVFKRHPSERILELLDKFGSVSGPINTYEELFGHPQFRALEMIAEMRDDTLRRGVNVVLAPWRLGGQSIRPPAPYVENARDLLGGSS